MSAEAMQAYLTTRRPLAQFALVALLLDRKRCNPSHKSLAASMADIVIQLRAAGGEGCDLRAIPYALLLLVDAVSRRRSSHVRPADDTAVGGSPSQWTLMPPSPDDVGCILLAPITDSYSAEAWWHDPLLRLAGCCVTHCVKSVTAANRTAETCEEPSQHATLVDLVLTLTPCGHYLMPHRWPSTAVQRLRTIEAAFSASNQCTAVSAAAAATSPVFPLPLLLVSLGEDDEVDGTEATLLMKRFVGRPCRVVSMPFLSGGVVPLMPMLVAGDWLQVLTTHVVSTAAATTEENVAMQHHLAELGRALMAGGCGGIDGQRANPADELLRRFYAPRLELNAVRLWFVVRYPHGVPHCFQAMPEGLSFVLPDTLLVNNSVPLVMPRQLPQSVHSILFAGSTSATASISRQRRAEGDGSVLHHSSLPVAMHAAAAAMISSIVEGLQLAHGDDAAHGRGDDPPPRSLEGAPQGVNLTVLRVSLPAAAPLSPVAGFDCRSPDASTNNTIRSAAVATANVIGRNTAVSQRGTLAGDRGGLFRLSGAPPTDSTGATVVRETAAFTTPDVREQPPIETSTVSGLLLVRPEVAASVASSVAAVVIDVPPPPVEAPKREAGGEPTRCIPSAKNSQRGPRSTAKQLMLAGDVASDPSSTAPLVVSRGTTEPDDAFTLPAVVVRGCETASSVPDGTRKRARAKMCVGDGRSPSAVGISAEALGTAGAPLPSNASTRKPRASAQRRQAAISAHTNAPLPCPSSGPPLP